LGNEQGDVLVWRELKPSNLGQMAEDGRWEQRALPPALLSNRFGVCDVVGQSWYT
jgi:hypothetical protein